MTYAVNYLAAVLHLTRVQAAAIVGNLSYEGTPILPGRKVIPKLFPQAVQITGKVLSAVDPKPPVPGIGVGIGQWTTKERQDALLALAREEGRPYVDFGVQLDYVIRELSDPRYQYLLPNPQTLRDLRRVKGDKLVALRAATAIVQLGFERPKDRAESIDARYDEARAALRLAHRRP